MATELPITGFPDLPTVAQDDVLIIVDVSDTSTSSAGTTKSITIANALAVLAAANLTGNIALGTGTISAARITTTNSFVGTGAVPVATNTHSGTVGSITVTGNSNGGKLAILSLTGTYLTITLTYAVAFPNGSSVTLTAGSTAIPSDTYVSSTSASACIITLGAAGLSSVSAQALYFSVNGF